MMICEQCGSPERVDIYNDFGDSPGVLICDACIYKAAMAAQPGPGVMIERPEGYYHAPIGFFD
jgi:hypothetical protein